MSILRNALVAVSNLGVGGHLSIFPVGVPLPTACFQPTMGADHRGALASPPPPHVHKDFSTYTYIFTLESSSVHLKMTA